MGVAVIDGGVDFLHRQLIGQTRFNQADGKISGAGFDAFGNDHNAHPSLIKPGLFALTSEKVVNGQLSGVLVDPLEWLNEVQKDFQTRFLSKLSADASISDSLLIQKFNRPHFPLFFVAIPYLEKAWLLNGKKNFEVAKSKGIFLDFKSDLSEKTRQEIGKFVLDQFVTQDWKLNESLGYPEHLVSKDKRSLFHRMKESNRLIEIAVESYAETDQKYSVQIHLENYNTFSNHLSVAFGTSKLEDRIDGLYQAWYFTQDEASRSPLFALIDGVCTSLPIKTREKLQAGLGHKGTQGGQDGISTELNESRWKIFREAIAHHFEIHSMVVDRYLKIQMLNRSEIRSIQKSAKSIGRYLQIVDEVFAQRPELKGHLDCKGNSVRQLSKAFSKYAQTANHPYLSDKSKGSSHGTHVSGIIARQSKKIDIIPVKVATSSIAAMPLEASQTLSNFKADYTKWIRLPGIAQALGSSKLAKGSFGKELSLEDLLSGMDDFLDEKYEEVFFEIQFFNQLKMSIEYVGASKIKIANVSLGTTYDKTVLSPDLKDKEKIIANFQKFSMTEFFKFSVAESIKKHSSKTLFVIASGNDGSWLDGSSKSGLPCDLSSPLLANIPGLPNNQLDNILCVGSTDNQDLISSYSNITLNSKVPFVFSRGEAVLSPIKTTDCSGVEDRLENELKKPEALSIWKLGGSENRFDDILQESGHWEIDPLNPDRDEESMRASNAIERMNRAFADGGMAFSALVQHHCMKSKGKNMARMSGTSMATPSVSGYIAKWVISKMRINQVDADIYEDPQFAPRQIIESILEAAPALGGDSRIGSIKVISEIKTWDKKKK